MKPNVCPEGQSNTNTEKQSQDDVNKKPIIDVFLNPQRSDELEKLLKLPQDNKAIADMTKVPVLI